MSENIELYRVTGIFERVDITEKGTFRRFVEVKFVTKSGVESSIMIPKEKFRKEEVEKRIEKEAKEIEETLALKV